MTFNRCSATISWALFRLARDPVVQTQLRNECLAYGEALPFEQLDELPFLDAVLMETLRMHPSAASTVSTPEDRNRHFRQSS
jgi:cytochrome P450